MAALPAAPLLGWLSEAAWQEVESGEQWPTAYGPATRRGEAAACDGSAGRGSEQRTRRGGGGSGGKAGQQGVQQLAPGLLVGLQSARKGSRWVGELVGAQGKSASCSGEVGQAPAHPPLALISSVRLASPASCLGPSQGAPPPSRVWPRPVRRAARPPGREQGGPSCRQLGDQGGEARGCESSARHLAACTAAPSHPALPRWKGGMSAIALCCTAGT